MMNRLNMYHSSQISSKPSHSSLKFYAFVFILLIAVLTVFYLKRPHTTTASNSKTTPPPSANDQFLVRVNKMTLEEKVRQIIICSYPGTNVDVAITKSPYCGNFILFSENTRGLTTNQIKANNEAIHKNDNLTWIMIDEEGGKVSRIDTNAPSARTIGKENTAAAWGNYHGQELNNLSIDVNLAPVSDIGTKSAVIGNRSFGDSPNAVMNSITEYLPMLQKNNVIGVIKHLPGHGRVLADTHKNKGTLNFDWNEILNYEMVPIVNVIDVGAKVFMIGHIIVPELDNKPASISKNTITHLRNFLPQGKDLIFMTDSLIMTGVGTSPIDASIAALDAGEDMILIPGVPEQAIYEKIIQEFNNNNLDINQLNQSVAKILKVKSEFGKNSL